MILLVSLGCTQSTQAPPPRIIVRIRSADDLPAAELLAVEPETTLELVIDAGTYTRGLQLDHDGPVDLVVRGVGEVRFVDAAVALRGRDVAVSGITFVGHPVSYALSVEARRTAVLDGVRLVGLRPFDAPLRTVGLVGLIAGGQGVGARVSGLQVVDSGFSEAVVVQVHAQPASDWSRLTVEGGDAAEWVGGALLSIEARVGVVDLRGGSWVLPPGAVLVRAQVPTGTSLSGNRIVLDNAAALGSVVAVDGDTFFARTGPSVRGIASTPGAHEESRAVAERIRDPLSAPATDPIANESEQRPRSRRSKSSSDLVHAGAEGRSEAGEGGAQARRVEGQGVEAAAGRGGVPEPERAGTRRGVSTAAVSIALGKLRESEA